MNAKPNIAILFILLFVACKKDKVQEVSNSSFQKYYGSTNDEIGNEILEFDNHLYLIGSTEVNGDRDLLFIKTDLDGNQIFYNRIGSAGTQYGQALCKTTDGNFLLLGFSNEGANRDVLVLKVTPNGQIIWTQNFGGPNEDYGVDVLELNNGNYFILANTKSKRNGGLDIWMLWLDSKGNLIRETTHGESEMDGGAESIELDNGDLMNFCYTWNYGATSRDFYLLKTNSDGDSLWSRRYGGNEYEESQNMNITPQGDILLIGHSTSTDPKHNMYAVKLNANGSILWEKNYGGILHDGGQCQLISSTGNYVFVGRSMSFGNGNRNAYCVTTNSSGEVINDEVIGGSGDDRIDDIIEYDGHYYLLGHSNSAGAGLNDVWLIKKKV